MLNTRKEVGHANRFHRIRISSLLQEVGGLTDLSDLIDIMQASIDFAWVKLYFNFSANISL